MIHGLRVLVTNEPTPLNADDAGDNIPGKGLVVRNRSSQTLDLGGPDVTTGAGFALDPGDSASIPLDHGETAYAVGPSPGPFRLDVLRSGVAT